MEIVYLRAGDLPEGNKSFNHRDKRDEPGVSVYEAVRLEDGSYRVMMPAVNRTQWETAGWTLSGMYGRPFFLVTGKALKQRGSDGETLLKDPVLGEQVKVVTGRPWIVHPYKGKLPQEEIDRIRAEHDELYGPEEDSRVDNGPGEVGDEDDASAVISDDVVNQVRALINKDFIGDQQIDRIRQMVTNELFDEYRGKIGGHDAMLVEFPRRFAEALIMAIQNKLAESITA